MRILKWLAYQILTGVVWLGRKLHVLPKEDEI